ncbi:hypothetical protein MTZ49_12760 [Entomomonas sp. E2T0]|uniref:hypothetical protein n=1 Tax=Entomomonas sp. E2T0 TaxID=2930213 RepID=UPI0022284445|nr:hypothetical protein [Entomomonas sp. E2T0]UYZ83458.1 hypothetical protein MTZ49_12760 [Entomomonas sp. E2T0]
MMNKNTLQINKQDGSLTIKNYPIVLKKGTTREEIGTVLTHLYRSNIDYKNGTEWMFFEEIEFSECPCTLGLYIDHGVLTEAKITIVPVHSDRSAAGWSSNATVDEAVLLALIEYRIQLSRPFKEGTEFFDWGEVWCLPDYKRSEMNSGIKYK